jgi:hypothetical protein
VELYCAAGHEGGGQAVDDAVDVVEWEDVDEVV